MRVASWRDGGGPGQRASQFSPLVTASGGPAKHVAVAVDRRFPDWPLPVTSDSALSNHGDRRHPLSHEGRKTRRPVSESSLELVQPTKRIPVLPFLFGRFFSRAPTSAESLPMRGYLRITSAQKVPHRATSPRDLATRQVCAHRRNPSRLRH
jgi:hypothetical protein